MINNQLQKLYIVIEQKMYRDIRYYRVIAQAQVYNPFKDSY